MDKHRAHPFGLVIQHQLTTEHVALAAVANEDEVGFGIQRRQLDEIAELGECLHFVDIANSRYSSGSGQQVVASDDLSSRRKQWI